jgi:hypothetical protein
MVTRTWDVGLHVRVSHMCVLGVITISLVSNGRNWIPIRQESVPVSAITWVSLYYARRTRVKQGKCDDI